MTRCRYCNRPIYKRLIGWGHFAFYKPAATHIARPRR